ncbi:hypothetical protein ACIVBQ_001020 [Tenacibaculum discolor]
MSFKAIFFALFFNSTLVELKFISTFVELILIL